MGSCLGKSDNLVVAEPTGPSSQAAPMPPTQTGTTGPGTPPATGGKPLPAEMVKRELEKAASLGELLDALARYAESDAVVSSQGEKIAGAGVKTGAQILTALGGLAEEVLKGGGDAPYIGFAFKIGSGLVDRVKDSFEKENENKGDLESLANTLEIFTNRLSFFYEFGNIRDELALSNQPHLKSHLVSNFEKMVKAALKGGMVIALCTRSTYKSRLFNAKDDAGSLGELKADIEKLDADLNMLGQDNNAADQKLKEQAEKMAELEKKFLEGAEPAFRYFKMGPVGQSGAFAYLQDYAFKKLEKADVDAIKSNRGILEVFWNEFQGLAVLHNLPIGVYDGSNHKWARKGREYRLLVEPVDIANWYHKGIHKDPPENGSCHYIDRLRDDQHGRPGRFNFLERFDRCVFTKEEPADSLELARILKAQFVEAEAVDAAVLIPEQPEVPPPQQGSAPLQHPAPEVSGVAGDPGRG